MLASDFKVLNLHVVRVCEYTFNYRGPFDNQFLFGLPYILLFRHFIGSVFP
eukprot:c43590_g1_i1 orf=1-150(-)